MGDLVAWVDWLSSLTVGPVFLYFIIFAVLIVCGFGLPIPEDITLAAGGILCGLGLTDFKTMLVVCLVGVLLGDSTVFLIGYHQGSKIFQMPFFQRLLTPARFKKVRDKFEKHGDWVLFIARFLPGLRMPIFLTAGTTRGISYKKFLIADGSAALLSVPAIVTVSYLFTDKIDEAVALIKKGQLVTLLGIFVLVAFLFLFFKFRKKKAKEAQKNI